MFRDRIRDGRKKGTRKSHKQKKQDPGHSARCYIIANFCRFESHPFHEPEIDAHEQTEQKSDYCKRYPYFKKNGGSYITASVSCNLIWHKFPEKIKAGDQCADGS